MNNQQLHALQGKVNEIDNVLIRLLNERSRLFKELPPESSARSIRYVESVWDEAANKEPDGYSLDGSTIRRLLQEIVKATQAPAKPSRPVPRVSRQAQREDTVIRFGDLELGGGSTELIAGPCSIESYDQMRQTAEALREKGVRIIRGGAFKPRTSPYDFQGLGIDGLKLMKEVADEFGLLTISEVVTPAHLEAAAPYLDIVQIGARNMQNFELLKEAGKMQVPVLLKRGLAATLEEFLMAAEYIVSGGNGKVMLIERGIRTYEKWTRNTLDISAVPILKQESHLPVLVDVSHSTGRKDILLPCAKAALAAGADGVMVEVHPNPPEALSDSEQQIDLEQFRTFADQLMASSLWNRSGQTIY
ncbi:bifunctional 3-deoxy-7-phosphoheptulonate synthase/chorismate mutase [Paenibacillus sp. J2TS4]|uniref:bifunctional 3-deoxy-7-phosphoheptulonate synthase/chorismate mutase n=1 Tax=Paenibacillus sp. J2TS4 TaxID=2807194 RepID=UPI001B2EA0CA|nr:bifunctional 3-deoxy-7-phosphoheptulonate synthase/chorismate mutase [Paenibacillus sp. J2TS4]GIP34619.1 bifunctional 3-deoxy-7-phosphoheptulonate synthase/chorismate mutase [Paenibacillus sp. J2TS4]